MALNRRDALGISLGALLASRVGHSAALERSSRTRVVLLGTAGGSLYVVDCGNGVARQIVEAGFQLRALKNIFITHQHSDHNLDYGNLVYLAWVAGLKDRINSYGPPPLAQMTKTFFELNKFDIDLRIRDEGRPDAKSLLIPHELRSGGVVMQDGNVKVTCALVDHPPIPVALSYRFDTPNRSVVFS